MNEAAYALSRKINPHLNPTVAEVGGAKPDGTPDSNDRVEIGPTALAFQEWAAAGLQAPNLERMRSFRLQRLIEHIRTRDLGGVLVSDPLNIRYATDTTNMQLWNTHNMFRVCFVSADGYMIVWDYKGLDLLTAYNPLVREVRGGASTFYFSSGDGAEGDAERFAGEIVDVMREQCGSNRRLAVDKIMINGLLALQAKGIEVCDGEEVMEKTRAVKGEEEIKAMRCAVHACEQSLHEMQRQAAPGMTENDVWAVLHAENIKRGGEWIETRLLSSGQRTNPWFQECGPRIIQNNEILAFDTDLIGCYGMCVDISRTWFIGDGEPTAEQKRLYTEAYLQIMDNTKTLAPGKMIADVIADLRRMPAEFDKGKYGCAMHGVGLCDEWPLITYQDKYEAGRFDYPLEPGNMICVEAYIGAEGGAEGIKLEDQVLITETGVEVMSLYPYEDNLIA